ARQIHYNRGPESALLLLALSPDVRSRSANYRLYEMAELAIPERNGRQMGHSGARSDLRRRNRNDRRRSLAAVPGESRRARASDGIAPVCRRLFRRAEYDFSGHAADGWLSRQHDGEDEFLYRAGESRPYCQPRAETG